MTLWDQRMSAERLRWTSWGLARQERFSKHQALPIPGAVPVALDGDDFIKQGSGHLGEPSSAAESQGAEAGRAVICILPPRRVINVGDDLPQEFWR